jgi:hypothetical protein
VYPQAPVYYPPYPPPPVYVPEYVREYVPHRRSRRSTCGEYHYWDGSCCVDARRHRPHIKRWCD